jgi:hypothetical protein
MLSNLFKLFLAFLLMAAALEALGKSYWANQMALYSFYLLVAGVFLLIYLYVNENENIKEKSR